MKVDIKRRKTLGFLATGAAVAACLPYTRLLNALPKDKEIKDMDPIRGDDNPTPPLTLTESEWKERLTDQQFNVLREEGTEPAFSGNLWDNHQEGTYLCAGCQLSVFSSETKFESGTGWPSFYAPIDSTHIATKTDWKLIYPRTEVHCARCHGHFGHVFKDGPPPTGLRYCLNSAALLFLPKAVVAN